jgi:elongation factor 3
MRHTGAGKSTLLKAINRHQIKNFPEDVSTFYVEHDIDGEESSISVVKFLLADRFVKAKGVDEKRVVEVLRETGFDENRQDVAVTALSGGWKMRLALARAIICQVRLTLSRSPVNALC